MKNCILNVLKAITFLGAIFKNNILFVFCKIVISIFTAFSALLPAYFTKLIIDSMSSNQNIYYLAWIICLFVCWELVVYAFGVLMGYINEKFTVRIKDNLRLNLFYAINNLPYSKLETPEMQDFLSLACQGEENICAVLDNVLDFFSSAIRFISVATILFTIDPSLIFIIILCFALKYIVGIWQRKQIIKKRKEAMQSNRISKMVSKFFMGVEYGKEIRLMDLGELLLKKYKDSIRERNKYADKMKFIRTLSELYDSIIGNAQNLVAYIIIGLKVFNGTVSVGDFTFSLSCISTFSSSLDSFLSSVSSVMVNVKMIEEYRKCIDWSHQIEYEEEAKIPFPNQTQIEFSHVSFKYPGTDNYVLSDLSFTIKNGERISLVGKNGSGKSTIVKLLCRLYEPDCGEILINGIPVQSIDIKSYYEHIGAVFQDFKVYGFTLKENILFNDNEENLSSLINDVGLSKTVDSLPFGIDTLLSEEFSNDGIELSGGQIQKLIMARALAKRPGLLILDEPTSALDPIAEYELYRDFDSLTQERTTLFISHRLAHSRFSDRILVLANGKIEEAGTHDELMATGGIYADMFTTQSFFYNENIYSEAQEQ